MPSPSETASSSDSALVGDVEDECAVDEIDEGRTDSYGGETDTSGVDDGEQLGESRVAHREGVGSRVKREELVKGS